MDIIPLTLIVSLCLTFTFILFFVREQFRQRHPGHDRAALLPLTEETPRTAGPIVIDMAGRGHACAKRGRCARGENCEHGHGHAHPPGVSA